MDKPKLVINNNQCTYWTSKSPNISDRSFLLNNCTAIEEVTNVVMDSKRRRFGPNVVKSEQMVPLYKQVIHSDLIANIFPRGLYEIMSDDLKSQLDIIDRSTSEVTFDPNIVTPDYIREVLQPESGFNLRTDQISSVYKGLHKKRGIIQLPTGGGKTEVMASMIRILKRFNPDLKVLVIEPTDILTSSTSNRFNKYLLDSKVYKDTRGELTTTVTVSHPSSLINDLKVDNTLLRDVNVVFWDECHHLKSDTWSLLNMALKSVEYSIGVSALAVNEERIHQRNLRSFKYDEVMVQGSTGPVIMHVPPSYYIELGILATPVVIQMSSPGGVGNKWAELRKTVLEGDERSGITADVIRMFENYKRRTLVLVGTKDQAYTLSRFLIERDSSLADKIAVSFGGKESYTVSGLDASGDLVRTKHKGDIVKDFDEGNYTILLSTSHMDEGVDLSNLDVCVLASGGKKDRRIVQRIGRALRVSKTGKFAYIVDFTDGTRGVTANHSRLRMKLYEDLIEVPKKYIFKNVQPSSFIDDSSKSELVKIFTDLEEISI